MIRFDGIWLGLAAMVMSALLVTLALWYAIALLLSLQP